MAEIRIYRNYEYDRDPVLDEVAGMIEKERLVKKPGIVAEIATVSRQTIVNWLSGKTRRPQYATMMAVTASLGYRPRGWTQAERIDVDAARKASVKWKERQEAKKQAAKERLIAARKAARAQHVAGAAHNRR